MPTVSGTTGAPENFQDAGDEIYRFLANGSITFSVGGLVEYLIVAGGGAGGGAASFRNASAGAAGGMLTGSFNVTPTTYTINVGVGGIGGDATGTPKATKGQDSSIVGDNAPAVALGGGRGDQQNVDEHTGPNAGEQNGGSGAGRWFLSDTTRGGLGTVGQGNDGFGQAGGGADQPGSANGVDLGGDGRSSSITGVAVVYAGGGSANRSGGLGGLGGGGTSGDTAGVQQGGDGENGKGGGGGGAASNNGIGARGGHGGNGVIIIRFTPEGPSNVLASQKSSINSFIFNRVYGRVN